MPLRIQTDPTRIQSVLQVIISQNRPPVARCRLLSSGFGPGHMLQTSDNLTGTKACLGCDLVQTLLAEGMAELLAKATSDEMYVLDLVLSG
jgi:hypothetical protein